MKRIILLPIALTVICSENGYAFDKNGKRKWFGELSCGSYLDVYSRMAFQGTNTYSSYPDGREVADWIEGFITDFNQFVDNGKANILGNMSINDARKWLASWCRDNPSKTLDLGIRSLAKSLSKN